MRAVCSRILCDKQWVQVGEPEVHRQRGKWVVRQSGYDGVTGRRRVRQLGTFPTRRAAEAHRRAVLDGRAGTEGGETVREYLEQSWLRPSRAGSTFTETWDGREAELRAIDGTVGEAWKQAYVAGDAEASNVLVGEAVGLVPTIEPARDVLERIVVEAQSLLDASWSRPD